MKEIITGYIPRELAIKVEDYLKAHGMTKTSAVEKGLRLLIGDWEPEELPIGYTRGQGGKLLREVKTRSGYIAWTEVPESELEDL